MPISTIDGCDESHWTEVRTILTEAAEAASFKARLVSESDDIGVIQDRIVQNIYDSDIVLADVSAKNANVMFELGMRLAFDRPAIVTKDDKTGYSFDTSPIEHLEYPRDLRYSDILRFKERLSGKLRSTFDASQKDGYKSFLQNFGQFKVSGLETVEVSQQEYLSNGLADIQRQLVRLDRRLDQNDNSIARRSPIPTAILARRFRSAIENGDLNYEELKTSPETAYKYVYDQIPSAFDSYQNPKEFEKGVQRALIYFFDRYGDKLE